MSNISLLVKAAQMDFEFSHLNLLQTECNGGTVTGHYNPDAPDLHFRQPSEFADDASRKAYSDSQVARYGFGYPWRQDPGVAPPAESLIPDPPLYINFGYREQENIEGGGVPSVKTWARFGLRMPTSGYPSATDVEDLQALYTFTEQVVKKIENAGITTTTQTGTQTGGSQVATPQAQTSNTVSTSSPTLQQIVESTLATMLPAILQAELARLLPNLPQAPAVAPTSAPAPVASSAPASVLQSNIDAAISPIASKATGYLAELEKQVGTSGGGHWAQELRALSLAVLTLNSKLTGASN